MFWSKYRIPVFCWKIDSFRRGLQFSWNSAVVQLSTTSQVRSTRHCRKIFKNHFRWHLLQPPRRRDFVKPRGNRKQTGPVPVYFPSPFISDGSSLYAFFLKISIQTLCTLLDEACRHDSIQEKIQRKRLVVCFLLL